jgi:hypothetical protein
MASSARRRGFDLNAGRPPTSLWQWTRHIMDSNHIKKIYDDVWVHPITAPEKRDAWYAKYFVWRIVNWTLATLSIMFPAIAAASGGTVATVFSVAAAVTAGMVAFLGSQDQKDKFNVAWLLLDAAIKSNDDLKIKEAEARGESIINGEALQKYAPDKFTKPQP